MATGGVQAVRALEGDVVDAAVDQAVVRLLFASFSFQRRFFVVVRLGVAVLSFGDVGSKVIDAAVGWFACGVCEWGERMENNTST